MTLPVGDKAVALIVGEEIGSFALYTAKYQRPDWPGGVSGVTWGIGYDGGQHTAAQIRADWTPHLSAADVEALCGVAGLKGEAARAKLASVQHVIVPIALAEAVFTNSTLPRYAQETESEMPNCSLLPPDAFGALVSISYNRGPAGFDSDSDSGRLREMEDIGDAMDDKAFDKVPPLIASMKRLWPVNSDLWNRRQHEATLFREALAASVVIPPAPVPSAPVVASPATPGFIATVASLFKPS